MERWKSFLGKQPHLVGTATGTDNKDRTGLSIHGGKEYGSGGCIDLTDKMDDFTDKFKRYGQDMILNVKYDKDCW